MHNNILITGSSGFVGTNLISYLSKEKIIVTGVTRKPKGKEISYKELNENTWNTSNAVIHLAGKAHDLKKIASDKEYYDVNRDLTINLFNQFLQSKCPIFIYISSWTNIGTIYSPLVFRVGSSVNRCCSECCCLVFVLRVHRTRGNLNIYIG